jgi:ParB-like chromosome segregation protein Spo0J
MSEQEQLETMLIENGQRESLTPLGRARGYKRLLDMGLSQAEIRRRTGFAPAHIASHLALLTLPERVQKLISCGRLPMGCIKILEGLPEDEARIAWAEKAVGANWSLDQLQTAITASSQSAARTQAKARTVVMRPTNGPVMTRDLALASLKLNRGWPFTLDILNLALDRVSCSCSGVDKEKHSKLCATCPLAHFLGAVLQEAHDVSR